MAIQRVVLIKLKEDYAKEAEREEIARHSREVLGRIPLVRALSVATPADGRCAKDWDLAILVRFDDLEAVESYRVERTHRAYVDLFLKPLMSKIRVWNFTLPVEEP